jgi:hypothetical protein
MRYRSGMSDQKAVQDLINEAGAQMRASFAIAELAIAGLRQAAGNLPPSGASETTEDSMVYVGPDDPFGPEGKRSVRVRVADLREAALHDGPAARELQQQWLVTTYQRWEDQWRPEIARLAGVNTRAIVSDVFGDLRRLRHDIIHCRGIATAVNAGKCQVLNVPIGDPIVCDAELFTKIDLDWNIRIETVQGT